MEQDNFIVEKPGIIELLSDSYGVPARRDNIQTRDKIDYEIMPSKSDYLIHYEIRKDKLVWMKDSNFDGNCDDVNVFPENERRTARTKKQNECFTHLNPYLL